MEKLLLSNIIILKTRAGPKDKPDKPSFRTYSTRRDNTFIKTSYINNTNV